MASKTSKTKGKPERPANLASNYQAIGPAAITAALLCLSSSKIRVAAQRG